MSLPTSVASLLASVHSHREADFYRLLWGTTQTFAEIPVVTRRELASTPLSRRSYAQGKSIVKIVRSEHDMFLSEWRFADIALEDWHIVTERPMVYMSDPHEAIEKSLWCYAHAMVPLIGEANVEVARYAAQLCMIDSLVADSDSLHALEPYLLSRNEPLERITIIGTTFDKERLASFALYARTIRLVLSLPETGAFAEASLTDPSFSPLPSCLIEDVGGSIILTKTRQLVTPIIRYDTGLRVSDQSVTTNYIRGAEMDRR